MGHRESDSRSRVGTAFLKPWRGGWSFVGWSRPDWAETLRESTSSASWPSFGGDAAPDGTKFWSYPGGSHFVEGMTGSNSVALVTETGSIRTKMLGYQGEIERNFDVSPSWAPVGASDSRSNGESASMGDVEPTEPGANPTRCGRVNLWQGVDDPAARRCWKKLSEDDVVRARIRALTRPEHFGLSERSSDDP